MRVLAVVLSLIPTLCFGQQGLSRDEVVSLMHDYALCYQPDEAGACAWAEVYNRFGEDSLFMMAASAAERGGISVLEERLIWIDDALCHLDNAEGVVSAYGSRDSYLDVQLRNIWDLAPDARDAMIDSWTSGRPGDVCFRYIRDPSNRDGLLQFTLYAGHPGKDPDPVRLMPRDRGRIEISQ